jgi:hypothetical protein
MPCPLILPDGEGSISSAGRRTVDMHLMAAGRTWVRT